MATDAADAPLGSRRPAAGGLPDHAIGPLRPAAVPGGGAGPRRAPVHAGCVALGRYGATPGGPGLRGASGRVSRVQRLRPGLRACRGRCLGTADEHRPARRPGCGCRHGPGRPTACRGRGGQLRRVLRAGRGDAGSGPLPLRGCRGSRSLLARALPAAGLPAPGDAGQACRPARGLSRSARRRHHGPCAGVDRRARPRGALGAGAALRTRGPAGRLPGHHRALPQWATRPRQPGRPLRLDGRRGAVPLAVSGGGRAAAGPSRTGQRPAIPGRHGPGRGAGYRPVRPLVMSCCSHHGRAGRLGTWCGTAGDDLLGGPQSASVRRVIPGGQRAKYAAIGSQYCFCQPSASIARPSGGVPEWVSVRRVPAPSGSSS